MRINMLKKSCSLLNFNCKRLLTMQRHVGYDWTKQEKILMEPFEYVQKLPCKHHNLMAPAFNHWLQVPKDKLNIIQEINRAWISWNILFDDIEDNSDFRYGVSAAHQVFGVGLTINAANKSLLLMYDQLIELGHPLGPKIFLKRLKEYLHGQGIDIYWRDNFICPTPEAHIEMKKNKCGACFVFPVDLLQLFSSNDKDYTGLAINIGIYYEILDDYYNLFHQKTLPKLAGVIQDNVNDDGIGRRNVNDDFGDDNHITCSDITEGKISLSVIHAAQFPDVADELAYILKQRTSDPNLQNRVIMLLKKHGSDEYTKNAMKTLEAKIRAEIDQLGGNPKLTAFMDDLSFHGHETEEDSYT